MIKIVNNKFSTLLIAIVLLFVAAACEQTHFDPDLATAPGGGTITKYKAYDLDSVAGMNNVYGRVVFWEGNADNTLVQLSLYNTTEGDSHPSGIFEGDLEDGSVTELMSLYTVDGTKGEFGVHKFYVIDDAEFYSKLSSYDAHVSVFKSAGDMSVISTGNVGLNAAPVQEN